MSKGQRQMMGLPIRAVTDLTARSLDQPAGLMPAAGYFSTFAALLFSGLFAGFLTTALVLEASLRDAGPAVYTQVRLVELEHLDDLASALLIPAILAAATMTVAALAGRGRRGWWACMTALILLLATLAISATFNVPINTAQLSWSVSSPPGDWSLVRDRWQLAHVARTATAASAFVLLIAAAMRPWPSRNTFQPNEIGDPAP